MLPATFSPTILRQLELLKLKARRAFLGQRQGGHLSLKRGHGQEFSDYRKYELGDSPRHIDWGLYARSERLYVKRFQEEQNLSILIIIDGSASMLQVAEGGKWARARDLALAFSYIALNQQDTVSISIIGGRESPSYIGAAAIHHAAKFLSDTNFTPNEDPLMSVRRAVSKIRFPGMALLISDFLFETDKIESILRLIRSKNLDCSAIQVLSDEDSDPLGAAQGALTVDSETGEEVEIGLDNTEREAYRTRIKEHSQELREILLENRMKFIEVSSEIDFSEVIVDRLPQIGAFA